MNRSKQGRQGARGLDEDERKALRRARQARWRARNPLWAAQRQIHQRAPHAVPPWLSAADRAEIDALYALAYELSQAGEPHEVDHDIPLVHHAVCGLHVPWNLRVITARENREKGNHYVA